MADPVKQAQTNQTVLLVMGAVMVFGAFQAVMITAHEYASSTTVWMELGFDALMTAVAPFLMSQVSRDAPESGMKTLALVLGAIGVVGGVVQLIARFTSDHGWWTGHFFYAV